MTALITSVLVASLLGSMHCAGMCGAFLAICVGAGDRVGRARVAQVAYHGGRLVSYTMLGAVAGTLGAALDLSGGVVGVQRLALVVAGVAVVGCGLSMLARVGGRRVPMPAVPRPIQRAARRVHEAAMRQPAVRMCFIIGLGSTLLPCGWLYAFAIVAAGTGSAWLGAFSMAVFWVGTIPVMAALGVGVQHLTGPLRRHLPVATALLLIVVGVMTIAGRFDVPALAAADLNDRPASAAAATAQVEAIDAGALPCCHGPS